MVASQETDRITVPWNSRPRDSSEWTKHGFGTFSAVYEHEHSHGREPSRYRTNREDRRQFHHCRSHTPTISKGQLVQRSLRYECSTFHLRCAWSVIRGMVIGSSDWRVSYSRQSLVFVDVLFMIIILCSLVHFRTSGLKSRTSTWTWQVQVQVGILDLNSRDSKDGFGIPGNSKI